MVVSLLMVLVMPLEGWKTAQRSRTDLKAALISWLMRLFGLEPLMKNLRVVLVHWLRMGLSL